ncbi:MAG: GntR family transcriptional regulator [Anaerolineae bacterium]
MTTLNHKTKKDLIVEILREAILSGELEPGERLLQEELAQRFKVSPTPIREAIRQLVAEGILDHSPHKGVQVAEVKLEDAREIYLIRSVLEALATRLAVPHLNSADVQRLHAWQEQMETQIEQGQLAALRKLNYEFHMLIYEVTGLTQLQQLIRSLWTKFPWDTLQILPGRASASAQEHHQIIQAIEDGNAELAGQRMQKHIESGAAALIDYLSNDTVTNPAETLP